MNSSINLSHLKYFVDTVETKSLINAAKRNYVTHSTISQGIKRFEESLGVQLCNHTKRKFSLTSEGEAIFEKCLKILQSVSELKGLSMLKGDIAGKVSFASSQSILSAFLLKCGTHLKKKHKNVTVNFEIGRTHEIKDYVISREVEFGITIDNGSLKGLKKEVLKVGSFVLLSRRNSKNFQVNPKFVLTQTRPETIALIDAYKKKFHRDLHLLYEVDSWNLIKEIVKKDEGIGFVPDFLFRNEKELKCVEWNPKIEYKLVLIYRENEVLSRQAEKFIEILKKYLST